MAPIEVQLDHETFSCSICLDLLKDPVTVACGHSYCMNCINTHWDEEDDTESYSCPQCRQAFEPRPVLVKSTMLAVLMEELKKTGLQAAPAGPEDVACDVCTERKLKALKSCLVCMASYCEKHLQPHYESSAFKKHKLVEPSKKLQENLCSCHDEVMKIVSTAAERTEREKELEEGRQKIQQRIQDREKDVKLLQQEVEAINRSADKAVEDSEKTFTELIGFIQKRSSEVKQQVRSQQETVVSRLNELQENMEQEIAELKRKDAELKMLSLTEDHTQFLHDYPSLLPLIEATHSSSINIRPLSFFEHVTAAVLETRDKQQDILRETLTKISLRGTEVEVLLSRLEPTTRDDFLKYSCEITMDPNTVNSQLLLSDGNRKATITRECQSYPDHPDRLSYRKVLSKESLTGRCYLEVKYNAQQEGVYILVEGMNKGRFGDNDSSWELNCKNDGCTFSYKGVCYPVSGHSACGTRIIGVYLDHSAGLLSFYNVSETMTLIHRHHTRFTQPLYAGVRFKYWYGSTAEFIQLK